MSEPTKRHRKAVKKTEHEIRDEATPRDYFCQIPNLVDEMNLTPYAYRLYGHLRRVTGEAGKCWQSTRTLAEKCRMSMASVSEAKKELANTDPPLIRIASETGPKGVYHVITITDIWSINHDYSTGVSVRLVKSPPKRSHGEQERSSSEQQRSHGETKNISSKKTSSKKNTVSEKKKEISAVFSELEKLGYKAKEDDEHTIEFWLEKYPAWQILETIKESCFSAEYGLSYIEKVLLIVQHLSEIDTAGVLSSLYAERGAEQSDLVDPVGVNISSLAHSQAVPA